jgi:hypothetical protein
VPHAFLSLCLCSQYSLGLGCLLLHVCLNQVQKKFCRNSVVPVLHSNWEELFQATGVSSLDLPLPPNLVAGQCETDKGIASLERFPPVCVCQLEACFLAYACKYQAYLLILFFVWLLWTQQVPPNNFRQGRTLPSPVHGVKWQVRPVNRIVSFCEAQLPVETGSLQNTPQRHMAWMGAGRWVLTWLVSLYIAILSEGEPKLLVRVLLTPSRRAVMWHNAGVARCGYLENPFSWPAFYTLLEYKKQSACVFVCGIFSPVVGGR